MVRRNALRWLSGLLPGPYNLFLIISCQLQRKSQITRGKETESGRESSTCRPANRLVRCTLILSLKYRAQWTPCNRHCCAWLGDEHDPGGSRPRFHRLATKVNRRCCCVTIDYTSDRKTMVRGFSTRLNRVNRHDASGDVFATISRSAWKQLLGVSSRDSRANREKLWDWFYIRFVQGERVSTFLKEVSDFKIVYRLNDGRVANLAMGCLRADENLLGYFYATFLFYAK